MTDKDKQSVQVIWNSNFTSPLCKIWKKSVISNQKVKKVVKCCTMAIIVYVYTPNWMHGVLLHYSELSINVCLAQCCIFFHTNFFFSSRIFQQTFIISRIVWYLCLDYFQHQISIYLLLEVTLLFTIRSNFFRRL